VASPKKRVTLRDIAREAGVHFTTVGLALQGSPQLPAATKSRIRAVAEKLGYRPDPMLSALNAYRQSRMRPRYQATIAWINNWPDREALHRIQEFQDYYDGARQRAEEKGYALEEFWLHEKGMTPQRLSKVLRARNIETLLMAPQPAAHAVPPLNYEDFAVVAFGYSLQPAVFHVVTNHHFHSMNLLLEHLQALGYARIGFVGELIWNEKVDNAWLGGLALARLKNPQTGKIPPLFEDAHIERTLPIWLKRHRPDVVISHRYMLTRLRGVGCRIPEEIGFAGLGVDRSNSDISGIYQNSERIGRAAVDFVISMLHNGERGVPDVPTRMLIESTWNPGKTLRPERQRASRRAS